MLLQLSKLFYFFYNFFLRYPTPVNLGYLWNFGVCSLAFLFIQIITGFFLSMNYVASAELAFNSVEIIMRDINFGWLLRYIHSNGASFFFICVYIHMFRGMYYFSFLKPRQNVWNVGVIILLFMIITAFTGYVLPRGQMSFWAATVITNLASAVPLFGDFIVVWLWGGFSINTFTLNRFFSIHYLLPFIILFLVSIHIIFLHDKGSSNRLRVIFKIDKIMFHPYFTVKDLYFILLVFFFFSIFLFYAPNYLSHPDNYIPADPLVTPAHIVPEWYFLPFHAMLRSIPSKLAGVIVLLLSIIILLIFPLFFSYKNDISKYNFKIARTDNDNLLLSINSNLNKIKSSISLFRGIVVLKGVNIFNAFNIKFKINKTALYCKISPIVFNYFNLAVQYLKNNLTSYSYLFSTFIITWFVLTVIGSRPIDFPYLSIGRVYTFFYFFYFLSIIIYYNYLNIKIFIFNTYFNIFYNFYLINYINKFTNK